MRTDGKRKRPYDGMEVERVPLAELRPYDNNAKRHTREQLDAVEASIREFGFRNPILAWHDADGVPEIVAGHARAKAAQNLGMSEVPVLFVDDLTDAQRRALTLADNQTTMMTGWDEDMLAYELDVLSQEFDMQDFGFDVGAISDLGGEEAEEVGLPEDVEARCKPGDLWLLGEHRLLCGSATGRDDVQRLAGGVQADLYLTDPPYNIAYEGKTKDRLTIENDSWSDDDAFVSFLEAAFSNALEVLRPGGAFYIWHADTQGMSFRRACGECGMRIRQVLVWAKNNFTLGRQDYQWRHEPCIYGWKDGAAHDWLSDRSQTTVLEFDRPSRSEEHPTMKPVPLMAYQVANSTRKGGTVLDTFGGSGSTMMACEQVGRRCLTMELDPHYCDVIIARWEGMTGGTATLAES
nr:site-specific DNA-methyltransferase [uncultured Olsenella sp.]